MDFTSLFRLFGKHSNSKPQARLPRKRPRSQLFLEQLEARDLLAPIAISQVTPNDGEFSLSTLPALKVTFNQNVLGAGTATNYALYDSGGNLVPINSVDYSAPAGGPFVATVNYNGGQALDVDTYTLFIRGNNISNALGQQLDQSTQLVVANRSSGAVSTVKVASNTLLDATTNFPFLDSINPSSAVFADANGDLRNDLLLIDLAANRINIFAGLAGSVYRSTPDAVVALSAGGGARSLALADINKDTRPDLVVTNATTNNVSIYLNSGGIQFGTRADVAVGLSPRGVVIADFDEDSNLDLAVANNGTTSDVDNPRDMVNDYFITMLPGNGNGTFGTATSIKVGDVSQASTFGRPTGIAGGQFSADLKVDLAVSGTGGLLVLTNTSMGTISFTNVLATSPSTTSVTTAFFRLPNTTPNQKLDLVATNVTTAGVNQFIVFQNNGLGGFTAGAPIPVSVNPSPAVSADINGDNLNELIISNNTNPGFVTAYTNLTPPNGAITFSAVGTRFPVDRNPVGFTVEDFNSDSIRDIVAVSAGVHDFALLRGNGNGTFKISTDLPGFGSAGVVTGDVNNDSLPDIVVPNANGGSVTVYLATSPGNYSSGISYSTNIGGLGVDPSSVALADLNNNGIPDLVVSSQRDGVLSILSNNGLGVFAVVGTQRVGFAPLKLVAGDFNNDGNADVAVAHIGGGVEDGPGGGGSITILLGKGDLTFSSGTETGSGIVPSSLAVGDFNNDGNLDLLATDNKALGRVLRLLGDGTGSFVFGGLFAVAPNPAGLRIGDLNGDGFLDVVTVSSAASAKSTISTLLSAAGGGFDRVFYSGIPGVTGLQDVALVNLNEDLYPDIVVSLAASGLNNLFSLISDGGGSFFNPLPYTSAEGPFPRPVPNNLAIISDPFHRVTSFRSGGITVRPNLVSNGDFENRDLSGERGNLDAWTTFEQPGTPGSRGQWATAKGVETPQNSITLSPPHQQYQAVLDQAELEPFGSHALYQDITIPASATNILLTFDLKWASFASFSDTSITPTLDFHLPAANQQIRVDLLNTLAAPLETSADAPASNFPGVLENLFLTNPATPTFSNLPFSRQLDIAKYAGKTIRLRIASTNNQGKLVVGIDNVQFRARYADAQFPALSSLTIRNPSSVASASVTDPTTDPTIIGKVGDNGSLNSVFYIEFDPENDGFGQLSDLRSVSIDPNGNFSFTVPLNSLLPGKNTVALRAVDRAGNFFSNAIEFVYQGPSNVNWSAQGPGPVNIESTGLGYPTVSGDITSIAVDPRDPSGNTYYVGAANGGVWKTTNGGNDWRVLTDNVRDASGQPIPVAVGSLAVGITSTPGPGQSGTVIYVGTGVTNSFLPPAFGVGVLKSIDDGISWTLLGQSALAGARVSKVLVDPANLNRAFVAVSSFADPNKNPGIFRTIDGGNTWVNVLDPTRMFLPGRTTTLGAGAPLASVTDMVLDPFTSNRLLIGLGNIGAVADNASAGVWRSNDGGDTWEQVVGGDQGANSTIPTGLTVGRVTIGIGNGRVGDEKFVYVMMGTPPPATQGVNSINRGSLLGLFKTDDNMLSFTRVMLRQNIGATKFAENFVDINILGANASDFGAVAVDPNDPNVVYVGGSTFAPPPGAPNHGLIRVDTNNMGNNGDDITKANLAANPPLMSDMPTPTPPLRQVNEYDPDPNQNTGPNQTPVGRPYTGEGVYWYDLIQASTNHTGAESLLPSNIRTIKFDGQGRLLFGTESGLFRGVPLYFGYDLVSGGLGIATNTGRNYTPLPATPTIVTGLNTTALNGNLQITQVTGVAFDPADRTRFYASQFASGTSLSAGGPLGWQTSGLSGPTSSSFTVIGAPNATAIRVGSPAGGPTGNTFSAVFRVWQASTPSANFPEISSDGGITFTPVALAGISPNEPAGLDPALAINPNKLFVNGVPHDQVLFGTQRVFQTDTTSNVWDPISPILSPGAFVSALAFAPTPGVYYAGTTDGQVFVQTPGANWPNRSSGLPGTPGTATAPRITNITVDPTNSGIAFALVDGVGFPHVFRTIDGGLNWTPSNALVGGGILADFPAYSMVIDPRSIPGAPNGRYYLGTANGVFASLDKGATWARLGQGLPGAPVVDLQFDPAQEVLMAATQGRGIFTISTRSSGPQVTAITPATPITQPLTQVTVTFNEDVDPRTFSLDANVAARTNLLNTLLNTDAYRQARAVSLYQKYLRRTPGPNESVNWAASIIQQSGEEQAIAALVSSQEYFANVALGNGNNAKWVNQIYLDLLFRTSAGDSGAASFLAALNSNSITRASVANSLVTSLEFRADETAVLFNEILGRNKPLPASFNDPELINWRELFSQGVRLEVLMANLYGSQEYYLNNDGFYPTGIGTTPIANALANITGNKDGNGTPILDLIVANIGANNVQVFQGRIGGGYASSPTVTLTLPANAAPRGIAVEDFNNDGKKDVAVVNSGTDNVSIFLNNSAGGNLSFVSNSGTLFSAGAGSGPVAIVAGKFSADNNIDLAVVSSKAVATKFNLNILVGTGTGSFAAPLIRDTTSTVALTNVAAGDVNGDNIQDFVVTASDGNSAPAGGVFLMRATSALTYATTNLSTVAAGSVALARVDTNTSLDIVTTPALGSTVRVFQNRGGSPVTFGTAVQFSAGANPQTVALGELNGDGRLDIAVSNATDPGGATTLFNTTTKATAGFDTITFANAINYLVPGGSPAAMVLGDTNQDLITDAVLAMPDTNAIAVLLGSSLSGFLPPTDQRFIVSIFKRLFATTPSAASLNAHVATLGQTEQSRLTGPIGAITPLSIEEVPSAPRRSFLLTFPAQLADGTYTLTIGPNTLQNNIRDFTDINGTYQNAGNAMNQNGNAPNGEFAADRFSGVFALNTSDNGHFISGLYHDLLGIDPGGRTPESTGFINFLGAVDAARFASLAATAPLFTTSLEYRGGLVQGYYVKYLRRASAPSLFGAEVQGWVSLMNSGAITEEGIIATFVASGEYFQNPALGNNNNATWVNQAYTDLLGRGSAGDAGAAGFLASLNAGTLSRADVATALVRSDEFLKRVIFATFAQLLGRAPVDNIDPAQNEFNSWLPTVRQTTFLPGGPTPDQQFVNALVSSGEYFQHVGNTNRQWVASLYTKVLGRSAIDANGTEVNGALGSVLNGYTITRLNTATAIATSIEHQNRTVADYYQTYLRRPAGAGETGAWVAQAIRDEQILAGILSSQEYFPLTGAGSSNASWVDKVYNDLLKHTSAGDSGATSFVNQLNNTPPPLLGQARASVALTILNSTEYRRILIASFFNKYLGRAKPIPVVGPDPELDPWVNGLAAGATQEQIIARLLASAEYFLRSHPLP